MRTSLFFLTASRCAAMHPLLLRFTINRFVPPATWSSLVGCALDHDGHARFARRELAPAPTAAGATLAESCRILQPSIALALAATARAFNPLVPTITAAVAATSRSCSCSRSSSRRSHAAPHCVSTSRSFGVQTSCGCRYQTGVRPVRLGIRCGGGTRSSSSSSCQFAAGQVSHVFPTLDVRLVGSISTPTDSFVRFGIVLPTPLHGSQLLSVTGSVSACR